MNSPGRPERVGYLNRAEAGSVAPRPVRITRLPGLTLRRGPEAMPDPLTAISTRRTPQREPADDRQVPNSAGGYSFTVTNLDRLRRFLTLGTDGGTFYVSE